MKTIRIIFRTLLGLTFMFSGIVKGVDPLGSVYKFNEYFEAWGTEWMSPLSLVLVILLCMVEFTTGVMLLFNVKPKLSSWFAFLIMLFFTVLTYISAINNPVTDCGCFGDAIKLSNWNTFYKNIVLIIMTIFLLFTNKISKPAFNKKIELLIIILGAGFIVHASVYCLNHLPVIDEFPFRKQLGLWNDLPWKKGDTIAKQVVATPEISEVVLVYKDKKTGKEEEYTSKTLPWKDSVKMANIEFVRQDKKIIQPYKEAPIHDFIIYDDTINRTAEIITNPGYQFILAAPDIFKTKKTIYAEINKFVENCDKDSISFIGLSGSIPDDVELFRHEVQAIFPIYNVDETALKTMVRANPGIVLIHNGVVVEKWHWRDFPEYSTVKEKYLNK